jgi:phospholipid/cholesterol/gamma-HCH transport system substrate-binding protein
MKFSIRFSDQIVGTLVIVALAMLIFVIFMLGTTQRWFMRDVQYITYFPSAAGISSNMPVQYKGFNIGQVKRISLTESDKVEVLFEIFEEHTLRVKEGSLVEIQVSPIGLGSSFIFHPGIGVDLVPEGTLIPEVNSKEARELAATGLVGRPESSADGINAILNQVNTLLETINAALGSPNEYDDPPLTIILNNIAGIIENVNTSLNPILNNFETLTDQLASPSGTVMMALDGHGPVYSSLEQSLVSISGIIKDLERTVEFLPSQLPAVGVLISQLNVTLNSVQDVLAAVANNPILRGGVPERQESGPGGASPRDTDFLRR